MQLTPRLVLMLATPPAMWASNAVVGRLAINSIDPLWLNAIRWMVAFVLLLPLGWAALSTPAARAQIAARWQYLAILGLIGVGAYNALQYMALRTSTPLNVTLIALGVVHGREVREHVHLQLVVVAQEGGHGRPVGRGDVAAVVAAEVAGGEDLVAELSLEASYGRLAHP